MILKFLDKIGRKKIVLDNKLVHVPMSRLLMSYLLNFFERSLLVSTFLLRSLLFLRVSSHEQINHE